jgi:hypothetical protein
MSRTLGPAARSSAAAFAVAFVFLGCGDDRNPGAENLPPTARLTAGPVEGDTTSYQVRLFWTGEDPDGFVSGYQYAMDPPAAFTEEEIAEGGPTVAVATLVGVGDAPTITRVSKVVDGDLISFDWVHTSEFNRIFLFSATEPESSTTSDGTRHVTGRSTGMHAVYIRAVDDDGALSPPARTAFNSRTVAPITRLTQPVPALQPSGSFLVGAFIRLDWVGEDPDGGSAEAPLRYEYSLVDCTHLTPPISVLSILDPALFARNKARWQPVPADSQQVRTYLNEASQYVFLVRAIDEAGAVEPFFEWGRNACKFVSLGSYGFPNFTLTSVLGTFAYSSPDEEHSVEMPADLPLSFTVSATAEPYGETIRGWRWRLRRSGWSSGLWSAWTRNPVLPDITVSQAGAWDLVVEVADEAGQVLSGTLKLTVLDMPLDREVLWVDDARDKTFPTDAQHDAFWLSLFQDSGRFDMASDFFKFEIHGASDVFTATPIPPTLEQLGRYKLVVWECNGDGYNGMSGLLVVSTLRRELGPYLLAGGQLWVDGVLTVPAMGRSPNGMNADFVYPKDMTADPNSFAFHFMKLASSRTMNAKGVPGGDNLIGVKPFPGRAETYPQMDQDSNKMNFFKTSISHCDAVFDPIDMAAAGRAGILDSLYVYQAKSATSSYQNKLNAVRWHDPDPAREHGRTQWFGFPLYYMKKDQAQETFNRAVDWFREEVRP